MDPIALRDLVTLLERRQSPPVQVGQPMVLVDLEGLESLSPPDANLVANRLPDDLRVYVGVRRTPLPVPLIGPGQQILERLTTTVSPRVGTLAETTPQGPGSATSAVVRVADPAATAAQMLGQAQRTPDAVYVVDTALRIAERATARETIIGESHGYTSLLAGPEYRAWRRASGDAVTGPPAQVLSEAAGERRTITLRWPTGASGMDHALRRELAQALLDARAGDATEIHLRSTGPDFCALAIPDDDPAQRSDRHAYLTRLQRHVGVAGWLTHRRLSAHVQGRCSSAGLELVAFAHAVTATSDARFCVPHVSFGLCFGAGGTWSLTSRIGRWRTAYLALSGAEIDAATALRWGLVDAIEDEPAAPPAQRPDLEGRRPMPPHRPRRTTGASLPR